MKVQASGVTDIGRCREQNEDAFVCEPELGLFAVADGMGGHVAGEVASRLAIETLVERIQQARSAGPLEATTLAPALREALLEANQRIWGAVEGGAGPGRSMGTTLVALATSRDGHAVIAHVGDSRAYRLRDGQLVCLTQDHSWVHEQVRAGAITSEDAQRHPLRNIVTRALGSRPNVLVDVNDERIRPDDVFLLCSDGLNSMLPDADIAGILKSEAGDPGRACRRLVDEANRRGGEDNTTVVVVAFPSSEAHNS